ncbi:MAG TPA: FGGY-family carbohydrate kinase, partial [Urbifossiella sp.]
GVPSNAIIVGWDFSTTAVKALAFDLSGTVVARSWFKNDIWADFERQAAGPHFLDRGNREINLMQLEGQARASTRDITAKLRDMHRLNDWRGAGISATHHTAGWIDENHNPVRRAYCWDDQTLAEYHAIGLSRLGGAARVRELIGGPWAVRYSLSHLVKDEACLPDDDWRRMKWMMGHGPLAAGYLTGRFGVTSISSAASTGILDLRTDQWRREMLGAISRDDLRERAWAGLPRVVETFEPIGPLAEHLALDAEIAAVQRPFVYPTLDDQAAGLVGGGATNPGELAIILGSSAVVNSSSARAPATDSLDAMKLGWDGAYLWMRCYSNGAQFVESVEPQAVRIAVEREASESVPPLCGGVSVLPFLKSEPSLGVLKERVEWHSATRGESPAIRVRTAYEAIAYLIALGVRAHKEAGQNVSRITISGGLARSPLMCEILASVLASVLEPKKLPLVRLASDEGSALGAAVLALAGLETTLRAEKGISEPFTIGDAVAKLVQKRDEVAARPEWVELYRRGLAEFESRLR